MSVAIVLGGFFILLAVALIVTAAVRDMAAYFVFGVTSLAFAGVIVAEAPWWAFVGIALAGLGAWSLVAKAFKQGIATLVVAVVVFLIGGDINVFGWFTSFPWWVYLGGGLAVIGVIAWRWKRAAGIGVLAVALLVALLGVFAPGGNPQAAATTNTPSDEMQDALTIKTVSYNCKTDANGLVPPKIMALVPVKEGGRKYSDSVSTPFVAPEPAGMLDEAKAEVCSNPHLGSTLASFFANLELGSVKVVDLNPWLQEFAGDPISVVHKRAEYYVPLRDVANPTDEEVNTAAERNRAWQGVAEKVNTLLERFVLGSVEKKPSVRNYHLVAGGVVAGQLPPVENNPRQENLPALQLYLTEKGGETCLANVGLNDDDKRPELFECSLPPKPTKPGKPGSTTPGQPGCTTCDTTETCTNCTTTTTPGCKTCTTTTTPPFDDDKNASEAPGQGGAGDGGSGQYGGDGSTRHSVTEGASDPAAGDSHSGGGGSEPTNNPVPGGTTTQQPSQPTDPGAGSADDPGGCVLAPGETIEDC